MNNKQLFAMIVGGASFLAGAAVMLIPRRMRSRQDPLWLGDSYIPEYILQALNRDCKGRDKPSFSTPVGEITADKLLKAFNSCSDEKFVFSHNGVEIRALTRNKSFIVADLLISADLSYKNPLEVAYLAMDFQGKLLEVIAAGFKYEYEPLSLTSPANFGTLRSLVFYRGNLGGFRKFMELAVKLMSE